MKHGSRTGYHDGCRCEDCRKAEADYQRAYRKRARPWERTPAHRQLAELERRFVAMGAERIVTDAEIGAMTTDEARRHRRDENDRLAHLVKLTEEQR